MQNEFQRKLLKNCFLDFVVFCLPPVPGMANQGPPFTSQPNIPSVAGVKMQTSISTVTTAPQPMMPQQQVAPNQQQPVPPPGQPAPNQQPQQPPQQQPTPNQPTAPSVQPNMVIMIKLIISLRFLFFLFDEIEAKPIEL